ncbi:MAG: twin transmembrane helix small protein [Alphaproteobacteria bacterium]|nr:twin transmembrane helix small protein [Alphaproteobacteria bacterium]
MNGFLIFLLIVAMLLTLGTLFGGLFSMARGGEFNQRWGNKLMQIRVVMQGIAIVLFALVMMLSRG